MGEPTKIHVDAHCPRLSHTDDYLRYGRQMILDNFGLEGQIRLQHASIVVVGAGGLGCPALQYLAAAGVGRIGIIDHDVIEVSNLQRQILHREGSVGSYKAASAALAIQKINSRVEVVPIIAAIQPSNALKLLSSYDIILDCTDNAPTRYLLSDVAVRLGKPLVSGAAQKYEGQLCIYNLGENGPCYRCIFPKPPPVETTGSCGEVGVLGAVTGIIGNLQALETIKLITGLHDGESSLLLFSAISAPFFRTIKLRARKPTCAACGSEELKVGVIEETDYITFCGGPQPNWLERGLLLGEAGDRIHVQDLKTAMESPGHFTLIDVRPQTEFGICHLPGSQSIPLPVLLADPASHLPSTSKVFVICRLGNDSQIAAHALRNIDSSLDIKDIIGGLRAWSRDIDPQFPVY